MSVAVNSKQNPLPAPQVIMRFAESYNDTGIPMPAVLGSIAKELTLPNVDQVQIGNTVFIGHRGEGEHKNVMEGRALNVDTAKNFLRNGLIYIAYLQRKKIRYYRSDFKDPAFLTAFQYFHKQSEGTDTEIDVVQLSGDWYRAYVYIGDKSLHEYWSL